MATPATEVLDQELTVRFENRRPFTTRQLAAILLRITRIAQAPERFGRDCRVEVARIETGSLLLVLRFLTSERAGVVYAAAALAATLHGEFSAKSPNDAIARILDNAQVRSIVITTDDTVLRIDRQAVEPHENIAPSWRRPKHPRDLAPRRSPESGFTPRQLPSAMRSMLR